MLLDSVGSAARLYNSHRGSVLFFGWMRCSFQSPSRHAAWPANCSGPSVHSNFAGAEPAAGSPASEVLSRCFAARSDRILSLGVAFPATPASQKPIGLER